MYSSPQSSNSTVVGNHGRIVGVALMLFVIVGGGLTWHELPVAGRAMFVVALVMVAVMLHSTWWNRLVAEEAVLVVYDRVRRVRRIPYGAIWRITYVEKMVFSLDTEGYGEVWLNPNSPGLEDFITDLAARILRERESVELSGDLDVE